MVGNMVFNSQLGFIEIFISKISCDESILYLRVTRDSIGSLNLTKGSIS